MSHTPSLGLPPTAVLSSFPRRGRGVVVEHATDPATAERLSALGLSIGSTFTVLQPGSRPMVQVGECRIGLGPDLACAVRALAR